jgi:sec-independent protein translocase protein TatA
MFEGLFQPMHLLVILGIALLVFGPKKLPELGKGIGEGIRGFKSAMRENEEAPDQIAITDRDSGPRWLDSLLGVAPIGLCPLFDPCHPAVTPQSGTSHTSGSNLVEWRRIGRNILSASGVKRSHRCRAEQNFHTFPDFDKEEKEMKQCISKILSVAVCAVAIIVQANASGASKAIVVESAPDLPELAQRPSEAMYLQHTRAGQAFLYLEQDQGWKLAILDVIDPAKHTSGRASVD